MFEFSLSPSTEKVLVNKGSAGDCGTYISSDGGRGSVR